MPSKRGDDLFEWQENPRMNGLLKVFMRLSKTTSENKIFLVYFDESIRSDIYVLML